MTECEALLLSQRPELTFISSERKMTTDGMYVRRYYACPKHIAFEPIKKS